MSRREAKPKEMSLSEVASRLHALCGKADTLMKELESRSIAVPKDLDLAKIRADSERWHKASEEVLRAQMKYREALMDLFGRSYYTELFVAHLLKRERG